jgi:citrate synthase
MRGTKPGAASLAVEGMLERVCMSSAEEVIFEYLRRGEAIPGLGHPLYSEGDPRAAFLLSQLVDAFAGTPSIANVEGMVAAVERRELPPPNADFAVGALTHVAGLPRGYGEAIFSIARTAGWVAHLLEEYTQNRTYRLREIYTGPAPSSQ